MRLSTRLILFLVVSVITVMAGYAGITISKTRETLESEMKKMAMHMGVSAGLASIHHLESNDLHGIEDILDNLSRDPDVIGGAFFDRHGKLLGVSESLAEDLADTVQVYEESLGIYRVETTPDHTHYAYICGIQNRDGEVLGSLRLVLRERSMLPHVIRVRDQVLWAILALTGVLSAVVVYVLKRQIDEPLRELVAGAEALGRGELEHRIGEVGSAEMNSLASAFNQMATNLQAVTRSIVEERERVQDILDSVPESIIVVDEALKVMALNRSMSGVFDLDVEDALGEELSGVLPCSEDVGLTDAIQDVMGTAQNSFNLDEVTFDRVSGLLFNIQGSPLRSWNGGVNGVVVVLEDVTEEVLAIRTLREREVRYQSVVDNVVEGIITIDSRGIIESANPAAQQIFDYTPDEMIGRNVKMLMTKEIADEHDGYLARYLETGIAKVIGQGRRMDGQRRDGAIVPVELAVGEFELDGRKMYTGTIRDVSEQLRMELEVRRSQKLAAVGQLAAGVAHEIGTPLNVISANAEYVIGKFPEEGSDELRTIVSEVDRISDLVKRLMSLARQPEANREFVDVTLVIEDVIALLWHQLEKGNIEITKEVSEDIPLVMASRDEIMQVVLNLVINAWHAMPDGGRLAIRASGRTESADQVNPGSPMMCLSIEDTGTGIAEDDLDHVFEPFFTTKDVGQGLGLGLSIAHRVVIDHGGRIEVQSVVGGGTTFEILLPTESGQSDV